MLDVPTRHRPLRHLSTAAVVVDVLASLGACAFGVYELAAPERGNLGLGFAFIGGGIFGLVVGILLICQVVLIQKFVNYMYRVYDVLLEASDVMRRLQEQTHTIAENSSLSEWAKRVVYREKDYEYLRDTIHGAIVRQDWQSAEHLIRDMATELGYHDEASHLREKLDKARKATIEERIAAALARFELLCDQRKWDQAREECARLKALFPDWTSIANLPNELEERRKDVKRKLLRDYDEAVRNQDIDRAHRLLFALDQYLIPEEAEALKESARGVFRARLEQIKTQFTIAISYKQFDSAIEAGERLIREFPNSGYALEISKMLPILHQRVRTQSTPNVTTASPPAVS